MNKLVLCFLILCFKANSYEIASHNLLERLTLADVILVVKLDKPSKEPVSNEYSQYEGSFSIKKQLYGVPVEDQESINIFTLPIAESYFNCCNKNKQYLLFLTKSSDGSFYPILSQDNVFEVYTHQVMGWSDNNGSKANVSIKQVLSDIAKLNKQVIKRKESLKKLKEDKKQITFSFTPH